MTITTMSHLPSVPRDGSITLISRVLYALAGITLVGGVYFGISFMAAPSAMRGSLFMWQALSGPLADLLYQALTQVATALGGTLIALACIISTLLVAAGKLLSRTHDLSQRVARLEQMLVLDMPRPDR